MKKINLLMLIMVLSLVSCGKDKKNSESNNTNISEMVKDKFVLEMDAIYEKNDSLVVFYEKDGYFDYNKPNSLKVVGSNLPQRILFVLPENIGAENYKIVVSTNKEQKTLKVLNISVKNDNKLVFDGSNNKFDAFFMTDESFGWDSEKSLYTLNHSNQYPPALIGKPELKQILIK